MRFMIVGALLVLVAGSACGSGSGPETFADPNVAHERYSLVFSGSADDEPVAHLYAASGIDSKVRRLPAAFDGLERPVWAPGFAHLADESGVVMRSDGRGRRQLGLDLHTELPWWSPDGAEIVASTDAYEAGDILIVPVTGSGSKAIARGLQPSWAPDGRIYFQQAGSIQAIDPLSGRVVEIPNSGGWDLGYHAWSPDGRRVAYDVGMEGERTLWTLELGSDEPAQLLDDLDPPVVDVLAYAWAPNGEHMAVIAGRDDPTAEPLAAGTYGVRWELHIVDVKENTAVKLLDAEAHALSWSPDGRWIALERYWGFDRYRDPAVDIWVVRSDGTGLRRVTNGRKPGTHWDETTGTDYGSVAWVPASVVARALTKR